MVVNELTIALRLALAGQQEQSLTMLKALASSAPNEFRVWWALANVSQSPDEVRAALRRVIRLKPDHAEAHELLAELDQPVKSLKRRVSARSQNHQLF